MSRIGKKPVPIATAKASIAGQLVKVEGPKGKLELNVHPAIIVKMDDAKKELVVTRKDDERQSKALHGLTRALIANMVEGVIKGYQKNMEIQGVGFKAEMKGKTIVLSVGFANQITLDVPSNLNVSVEGNKVLVFSQFVEMLALLKKAIAQHGWPHFYLAGDTEKRGELVQRFQEAQGPAALRGLAEILQRLPPPSGIDRNGG